MNVHNKDFLIHIMGAPSISDWGGGGGQDRVGTEDGEQLLFLVFLVTYTILWQWPSNSPEITTYSINPCFAFSVPL